MLKEYRHNLPICTGVKLTEENFDQVFDWVRSYDHQAEAFSVQNRRAILLHRIDRSRSLSVACISDYIVKDHNIGSASLFHVLAQGWFENHYEVEDEN